MRATLVTGSVWEDITRAARASAARASVAVAYFGNGVSRMLPLVEGSRLVVDASEGAVKSGQTCPQELLKLMSRGVKVFSVPNLHAKVFVLGDRAFVGSANVSNRSAAQLVEAVVWTKDTRVVRDARKFVMGLCVNELTPTVLQLLAKQYRPPKIPNSQGRRRVVLHTSKLPSLPRLMLAQLQREEWPERDLDLHENSLRVAQKRREHPRTFELSSFHYTGKCPFKRGDKLIQVTKEDNGKLLVDPPGNVLHVRTRRDKKGLVSFVHVEHPNSRRRSAAALASLLGRGSLKRLRCNGEVRDKHFAQSLLNLWST
jgi:hypothetical protein